MYDLDISKKFKEVEEKSEIRLLPLLGSVPFVNVVTAFRVIPSDDLVWMVEKSPYTFVEGLKAISPSVIEQVPVEKLRAYLFSDNLDIIRRLHETLFDSFIITALRGMSVEEIESLMRNRNVVKVSDIILGINGIG